jgi:hypothetical protein
VLHNGDGLCYYDLHKELVGMAINTAEPSAEARAGACSPTTRWPAQGPAQAAPRSTATATWTGSAAEKEIQRPPHRLWAAAGETPDGFALTLTDEDGNAGSAHGPPAHQPATDAARPKPGLREQPGPLGGTIFQCTTSLHLPALVRAGLGAQRLRRDAVAAWRPPAPKAFERLPAHARWSRPCPTPKTR